MSSREHGPCWPRGYDAVSKRLWLNHQLLPEHLPGRSYKIIETKEEAEARFQQQAVCPVPSPPHSSLILHSDSDLHGEVINKMGDLYLSYLEEKHLRSRTIKGTK